ncbi:hypothetical protein G5V58_22820 [Nocardioides anomalus]|uniref:Uncharacterized protein n=1 Tax=Nocardioides anomalus TaxID=2712223 RepID=A0A6G6WJ17_9ACTN|nr:hypothetical protein [Nocardioides anomalus]QIG45219.1 hypothetical protein G5V58_22820 [Nocardioides anomalus]
MSDPDLTPEQEQRVRRLLAEARHDEPVPDDVAARLDRVLAGLAAEDPSAGPDAQLAPVVDLAARRRRRNAAALLAGAAAVIIGGFAVAQVIHVDDDDASSAGSDAGSSLTSQRGTDDSDDSAADASGSGGGGGNASPSPSQGVAPGAPEAARTPLELSAGSLATDVTEQLPKRGLDSAEALPGRSPSTPGFPCATSAPASAYGLGDLYPAYYDGIPAVLALRPPEGSSQRADVLDCATATELDSAELPAP